MDIPRHSWGMRKKKEKKIIIYEWAGGWMSQVPEPFIHLSLFFYFLFFFYFRIPTSNRPISSIIFIKHLPEDSSFSSFSLIFLFFNLPAPRTAFFFFIRHFFFFSIYSILPLSFRFQNWEMNFPVFQSDFCLQHFLFFAKYSNFFTFFFTYLSFFVTLNDALL